MDCNFAGVNCLTKFGENKPIIVWQMLENIVKCPHSLTHSLLRLTSW